MQTPFEIYQSYQENTRRAGDGVIRLTRLMADGGDIGEALLTACGVIDRMRGDVNDVVLHQAEKYLERMKGETT